jgi:Ca-activated chloride channel family protein
MNPFASFGITFANPWLLLLLALVPLISYIKGNRGRAPSVLFSSTGALRSLGAMVQSKSGSFLTSLLFAGLALLVVGLARPQSTKSITHTEASGVDIMILIDVSGSMITEDYFIGGKRYNRLDTIKQVTEKFIKGRPNDRIGIIAFASQPYLVSPLTLDHNWLFDNLDRVRIGVLNGIEDGTAIGSAMASACNRLKDKNSKSRVIILLTDGDNNTGKVSPETAAEVVKTMGIKFHAIGAGTNGVAPVPSLDRNGDYRTDWLGNRILNNVEVHFNEEGLKKVAQIAGGQYYRAADTHSLEEIYSQIDKLEKTKQELTQYRQYRELFPWFIGAGFGLLLLEMILAQTVWRKIP